MGEAKIDAEGAPPVSTRENVAETGYAAIRVEGLAKAYGQQTVVRDLTFSVVEGEIFALLGPNGAGKTTTIEILEGYRGADAGRAEVLGLHPQRDGRELKPQIGVVLQQDGVYPSLRALEVLQLFARFFSDPIPPMELLERLGLRESAQVRCRQLSGGQKRRLALALALVGRPRLLFLDEPTTGMDPQARRATWELLLDLKDHGVTILLTTHFMDEAERLADRIGILDHGRLIALDTPANLTREQSTTTVEVRFSADPAPELAKLSKLASIRSAREEAGTFVVETGDAPAMLVELTTFLRDKGMTLRELRVGRASLEDVFLRLTGKEMRE
jgi:ABC-2 type transport system ATP-binding protein